LYKNAVLCFTDAGNLSGGVNLCGTKFFGDQFFEETYLCELCELKDDGRNYNSQKFPLQGILKRYLIKARKTKGIDHMVSITTAINRKA